MQLPQYKQNNSLNELGPPPLTPLNEISYMPWSSSSSLYLTHSQGHISELSLPRVVLILKSQTLPYSSSTTSPSQLIHTFIPTSLVPQIYCYKPLIFSYFSRNLYFICGRVLFLLLCIPSLIFWINLSKALSIF